MTIYTTPTLNINIKKLIENYNQLKMLSIPSISAAVIKDDAYGLGAQKIAQELYNKCNCNRFFVAHAQEGAEIRPYVPHAKIYVLQGIGADTLSLFERYRLIPVISSPEMLRFWQQYKIENISPIIQIETGLNRLGFTEDELKQLSADELSEFSIVLSHLSCGDEQAHFMNYHQLERFKSIKNRFFPHTIATLSASDGVFLGTEFHFDMVRLGAAIYGINTAPYRQNQMQNIIELKAPVLQIKNVEKGEFIGYSATYRAPKDIKTAVVSIGYGDGLPRSLSNRGKVIFYENGTPYFCPILGRVSMDNIICDVSNLKNIKPGDFGTIINNDYTVDDVARDAGTIAYELISNLGKNPRIFKNYITK